MTMTSTGCKFGVFFLLFLLLWISTSTAQRKSYGQSCDGTLKCDKRAWLTCRNGTCDCMKPDVMMYDASIRKCASKAGERCKVIFEALDGNNVYELMDCVENSNCTSDGFCACKPKFYEDLNGTCPRSPSYMEACDTLVKCSTYEALHCTDGLCKCNETVSTFYSNSSDSNQCVGLGGEACVESKCISNATCSSQIVCLCNSGFYQDDDKLCVEKIGPLGNCTKNEQCMIFRGSQLVCHEGVCNCNPRTLKYGTAQKYGQLSQYGYSSSYFTGASLTQCLGLASSPCPAPDRLCVPNSFCNYNSHESNGVCTCTSGYTASKDGRCALGYGKSCSNSNSGACIQGLVCSFSSSSQLCNCPYKQQQFNSAAGSCMSTVDGPCGSSSLLVSSCVKNAECVLFSKGPFEMGHCACQKGYVKNHSDKCDLAFGRPCLPNPSSSGYVPCDTVAGLACLDFKCQCHEFAQYSEKYRKCLGLVGAQCHLNSTETQCVENTRCERVRPRLHGICKCPTGSGAGFKETIQYTCEDQSQVTKRSPTHDEE